MAQYHWLKKNPHTKIPQRHICVATVAKPHKHDPDLLQLAAWGMVAGDFVGGKWVETDSCSDVPQETFWINLREQLAHKGKTWIWLLCPRVDLPCLRFTEQIESGSFSRRYWVFADPPVIIDGYLHARSVRIVGLANWLPGDSFEIDVMANGEASLHGYNTGHGSTSRYCAEHLAKATAKAVGRILATVHREDLGHLRNTVGGQSLQSYRHLH